jgi:outer membrane protein OmpA-like peptidoglycan-associated protein
VARGVLRPLWATTLVCLLVLAAPGVETARGAPGQARSAAQLASAGLAHDQVRTARSPSQPAAQGMLRAGVRRGCWFAGRSARLTRACERQLRAAAKRLPRGTQVSVIGVSLDEPSTAQNRWLAKRRARAVVLYLRAIGVRGKLERRMVISRGGNAGSLARAVTVGGSLRTTVIFRKPR